MSYMCGLKLQLPGLEARSYLAPAPVEAVRVSEAASIGTAYDHQAEVTLPDDYIPRTSRTRRATNEEVPMASVELGSTYWLGNRNND